MTVELENKNSALQAENNAIKSVMEGLSAEKQALEQTVMDVLKANIALKAGGFLLEKKIGILQNQIIAQEATIRKLSDQNQHDQFTPTPVPIPKKRGK